MHRFYVEHPASAGKTAVLSPEESAHAARVLRLRPGEEIVLLWRMFCRAERRCRDYEAAYLCALGVSAGKEEQRPAPK